LACGVLGGPAAANHILTNWLKFSENPRETTQPCLLGAPLHFAALLQFSAAFGVATCATCSFWAVCPFIFYARTLLDSRCTMSDSTFWLSSQWHAPPAVVAACFLALATTYAFILRHRKAAAFADLSGRVVVICGASQGIARELAMHYARARCRLVLSSRNVQLLDELAIQCKQLGAQEAMVFQADFADDSSATQLVAFVTRHFNCLDILVLNMIKPFYGPWSSVASVSGSLLFDQAAACHPSFSALRTTFLRSCSVTPVPRYKPCGSSSTSVRARPIANKSNRHLQLQFVTMRRLLRLRFVLHGQSAAARARSWGRACASCQQHGVNHVRVYDMCDVSSCGVIHFNGGGYDSITCPRPPRLN
jgi:hypothetical protein